MSISFFRLGSFLLWFCWRYFHVLWAGNIHSPIFWLFLDLVFSLCPEFLRSFELGVFYVLNFFWQLSQFLLPKLLHLRFSLLSHILLVIFTSVISDLFPRFFISMFASICVFFIVSTSTFRSWIALFKTFTFLLVFSCMPHPLQWGLHAGSKAWTQFWANSFMET